MVGGALPWHGTRTSWNVERRCEFGRAKSPSDPGQAPDDHFRFLGCCHFGSAAFCAEPAYSLPHTAPRCMSKRVGNLGNRSWLLNAQRILALRNRVNYATRIGDSAFAEMVLAVEKLECIRVPAVRQSPARRRGSDTSLWKGVSASIRRSVRKSKKPARDSGPLHTLASPRRFAANPRLRVARDVARTV